MQQNSNHWRSSILTPIRWVGRRCQLVLEPQPEALAQRENTDFHGGDKSTATAQNEQVILTQLQLSF